MPEAIAETHTPAPAPSRHAPQGTISIVLAFSVCSRAAMSISPPVNLSVINAGYVFGASAIAGGAGAFEERVHYAKTRTKY